MGEQTDKTKEDNNLTEKETELETVQADEKDSESLDSNMTEEDATEMNMEELYEQSLRQIQEGELVEGEIIKIEDDFVLVDIGYKSEGVIPIREFKDQDGKVTAKKGDKIEVVLEKKEDDDGAVTLSIEKAKKIKVWDKIKEIYDSDGSISGTVISKVKGGLSVDIGLPAFLPGSHIDLHPIRNLDSLVGQEIELKILKYNKRRNNIIISRRAILEKDRLKQKATTLSLIEEGSVLKGTVKNITDYGLFVDLGGIDGLLHITDMSWGRIAHPSSMYQIGDEISVKVISFDREKERVSLGIKQLKPDPWLDAAERFAVGTKVTGKVANLTDYGAFVEIEEGVEGLIHISEMSWTKKVKHPSHIANIGDTVDAVILDLDTKSRRVSLGMKQIKPNPWDVVGEKYPVNTIIEGRIKNITDFGLFIGIDEDIDGLVHISDISWTKKIKHPSELYKKGEEIQAKVLSIDKENGRFTLGIKQLSKDPWEEIPNKYRPGTKITGKVTNITDFGLFVELNEGIEGLVHLSEISKDKSASPLGKYQIDDVIHALVVNVSKEEKKIGLSIKRLKEKELKDVYNKYEKKEEKVSSEFGKLIKEKLEENAALNLNNAENDKNNEESSKSDSEDSTEKNLVTEETTAENSVAENLTAEDSTAEKSTEKDSVAEDSTAENSVAENSTAEDSTADDSTADDSVEEKLTADESTEKDSVAEDSTAEDSG
ncbi:MAG: 30S ribosomal protein S1, partial [Thermodesulfobacteriota bacterium]|nr:30S ribosomal protein S1 [Thermodesulfobacteriota bacterium]